jgi:BASS family bile acid:Na+ symporter
MIVDLSVPTIVVLLMIAAGTGVQVHELGAALRRPIIPVGGTLAQVVALPLIALLLIGIFDPPPELAAGLILVAACPGGALSNFYCYLGRLCVSLSVVLTTLSTLLSLVTLPLVLLVALPFLGGNVDITIPVGRIALQLLVFLLLPIAVGMLIRRWLPDQVQRHAVRIRIAGLVLLVALLVLILVDQRETVIATYRAALWLAGLFTLLAFIVGWLVGAGVRLASGDRRVFAIEFAIRNLGAAALVATATFERPEFLAFGALFVVVQFPLVMLLLRASARTTRSA